MPLPWEGVPLAPRHWPGSPTVLTLAATLKLMFNRELEVVLCPSKGGRTLVKYTDLPLDRQVQFYRQFRDYYDHIIQRTLT